MRKAAILVACLLCAVGIATGDTGDALSRGPMQTNLTVPDAATFSVSFGDDDAITASGGAMLISPHAEGSVMKGGVTIFNPSRVSLRNAIDDNPKTVKLEGDSAFYAWQGGNTALIVVQPASMAAPSLEGGTLSFASLDANDSQVSTSAAARPRYRIRICNTWPNADANLELMRCVNGGGRCMVCITSYY